jgi:zinc transporter 9
MGLSLSYPRLNLSHLNLYVLAVGIFFLGAGASVFHGIHSLGAGADHQLESVFWTYVVLGVSGVLEGYSLHVALQGVREGAKTSGQSMAKYIASGTDPTTVAVLMEDGGALAGLFIAAVATALTHYTGSAVFDAFGSIGIGCLLGGIAYWLVAKNRQLLIGRSMDQAEQEQIKNLLRRDLSVAYITDCKTEEIGPRVYRFKAEVAWDGDKLAERYLARIGRDKFISRLQQALSDPFADRAQVDRILKAYGKGIISAVGGEVDRLENEIQVLNPNVRFVDLETDRGRVPARKTMPRGSTACSPSLDFMEEEEEEAKVPLQLKKDEK